MKITKLERKVVLNIFYKIGWKKAIRLFKGDKDQFNTLKRFMKYSDHSVDKEHIENIFLKHYEKVSSRKKLHPMEELVRQWNNKNEGLIRRKKIRIRNWREKGNNDNNKIIDQKFIAKYQGKSANWLVQKLRFKKSILKYHFNRLGLNINLNSRLDRKSLIALKELIELKERSLEHDMQKSVMVEHRRKKKTMRDALKAQNKKRREDKWAKKYHDEYDKARPIYTGMRD